MLKLGMRAVVIANPNAGQRHSGDFHARLHQVAPIDGDNLHWTRSAGDAMRLAKSVTLAGEADCIIVAGGDGTVNEAAAGIMGANVPPERRPKIGIVPMGTCNVLAEELGIQALDPMAQRTLLLSGGVRTIDIGKTPQGYLLLMAGCGFDATAVRNVDLPMKAVIGAPAYIFSALRTLADYVPNRVTLRIDDEIVSTEAYVVVVANVSSYGYRDLKVAPFAMPDDGWFDVCVFEKAPTATIGFVGQFLLMLAKRHLSDPRVRYFRAKHIQIDSDPPMHCQIDGEDAGKTPVNIELIPKALRIIAPT
jgi:diacylglycerol kinase (ATP)